MNDHFADAEKQERVMFTILQNCITIEEFKQNYEYLIKVLLIPKKNEIFKEAFNALKATSCCRPWAIELIKQEKEEAAEKN